MVLLYPQPTLRTRTLSADDPICSRWYGLIMPSFIVPAVSPKLLHFYLVLYSVQAGKYELTRALGVHSRDLRILDANVSNSSYPSCILCREHALVINLEFIQVRHSPRN
jgi:hypothetical protein